jgi:hypothetical protein
MWERRGAYRVLVEKPKRKRPLERPRSRRENIKMDLQEVGSEGVHCIKVAQDTDISLALVKTAMNFRVP